MEGNEVKKSLNIHCTPLVVAHVEVFASVRGLDPIGRATLN